MMFSAIFFRQRFWNEACRAAVYVWTTSGLYQVSQSSREVWRHTFGPVFDMWFAMAVSRVLARRRSP